MKNQDNSKSIASYGIDEKYRDLVPSIKFSQFFKELFGEEVYSLYYNEVTTAVFKANEIIGFQLIPSMSLQYLSDFKGKIINELINFNYINLNYEVINETNSAVINKTNNHISNCDQKK